MARNQYASHTDSSPSDLHVSIFETRLGWVAISACDGKLTRVSIGHQSEDSILPVIVTAEDLTEARVELADWNPDLRDELTRYADGEPVSFAHVELSWPRPLSSFRRRVISETRRISWGNTLTYGEVARRAGSPRAARAVGTAMSSNRFPFIVPCHRVVGSSGGLGGFTAPGGVGLKERLLEMENEKYAASPLFRGKQRART